MATINDIEYGMAVESWSVPIKAIDAQAIATKAAVAGARHFVTAIRASFNGVASGVQLRLVADLGGANEATKETFFVYNQIELLYGPKGLIMNNNNESVSAVLETGGFNVTGSVTLFGYTLPHSIT